jgi:hypothetical protein
MEKKKHGDTSKALRREWMEFVLTIKRKGMQKINQQH